MRDFLWEKRQRGCSLLTKRKRETLRNQGDGGDWVSDSVSCPKGAADEDVLGRFNTMIEPQRFWKQLPLVLNPGCDAF